MMSTYVTDFRYIMSTSVALGNQPKKFATEPSEVITASKLERKEKEPNMGIGGITLAMKLKLVA